MTQWEGTESRKPDPMAGEGDNTLSKETRVLQRQRKLSCTWFNTETSCLPVPGTWSCHQAQWLVLASECCGHQGKINYASSQKCDHFINTNNNNNNKLICTKYCMSYMWWSLHGCQILASSRLILLSQPSMVIWPPRADLALPQYPVLVQNVGNKVVKIFAS